MFTAAHAVFNTPQFDVPDKTGGVGAYANSSWAVSSAAAFAPVGQRDFSWFSAVCYLFGTHSTIIAIVVMRGVFCLSNCGSILSVPLIPDRELDQKPARFLDTRRSGPILCVQGGMSTGSLTVSDHSLSIFLVFVPSLSWQTTFAF
jgi:hypothetical protein